MNADGPSPEVIALFNESLELINSQQFQKAYKITLELLQDYPTRDSLLSNAIVSISKTDAVDETLFLTAFENLDQILFEKYFRSLCVALAARQELALQTLLRLLRLNANICSATFISSGKLPIIKPSEPLIDKGDLTVISEHLRFLATSFAEKKLWQDSLHLLDPLFENGLLDVNGLSDYLVLHQRLGRYEDALIIFDAHLSEVSDLPDAVIATYISCAIKSDKSTAANDWLVSVGFEGCAVRTEYRETEILRCNLLTDLGNYAEAELLNDALLLAFPDDSNCWNARASFLLNADRVDEALFAVEQAIGLDRDNAAALYNSASCNALLGNHESAIRDYEIAMNLDGGLDQERATYFLGVAYLRAGQLEQGFKCYEKRRLNWPKIKARVSDVAVNGSEISRVCEMSSCEDFGNVLIIGEQGIGDVLLVLRFVDECVERGIFKSATINYRSKLWPIAQFCFPRLEFINKNKLDRKRRFDCYELLYSVPSVLIDKGVPLDLKRSARSFGGFLPQGFGLTWASTNEKFGDSKNLKLKDLIQVLRRVFGKDILLYNFQHGDDAIAEFNRALIELDGNLDCLNILPFDPANDFLRVAEFCLANKVGVLGGSNTMMHIAGVSGLPGIVVPPQNSRALLWYWSLRDNEGRSKWYPSMKVAPSLEIAEEMLLGWNKDFRGKN